MSSIYQWYHFGNQKAVFQNHRVEIKFPCSECGANRPTHYNNESMQVGICPCKRDKEVKSNEV